MLYAYSATQNTLAGMNPNCDVLTAISQIKMLLIPAMSHPCQRFWPKRIAALIVNTQET
jgi:hypothetical protein